METDNTTVRYKRSVKLVYNESIRGQWSLNTPIGTNVGVLGHNWISILELLTTALINQSF